jgi:hypothetical protein
VDVNKNRRLRAIGPIDVELLGVGRAVGFAPRRPEARTRQFAVAGEARADLAAERCVEGLIIGGVELDLIQIHPDARPFLVRGRPNRTLQCQRRRRDAGCRRTEHRPSRERIAILSTR